MKTTIRNVRLAFPRVFEPQEAPDGGDPRYNATFIIEDQPTRDRIEEIIEAVAREKWENKAEATLEKLRANSRTCHRDGAAKADYDGFEGNTFVTAGNKMQPAIFDRDGSTLQQRDGRPYPGCYVDASIDIWAQDNQHGKRINAQLRGLRFAQDGEPFAGGSGVATSDDFEFDAPDDSAADDLL